MLLTLASELKEILEDYEMVEGANLNDPPDISSGQNSCPTLVKSPVNFDLFPFRKRASDFFNEMVVNTEELKATPTPPPSPSHTGNYDYNRSTEWVRQVDNFLAALRYEVESSENELADLVEAPANTISDIKQRLRKRSAVVSYSLVKRKKRLNSKKDVVPKKTKKVVPQAKRCLVMKTEKASSSSDDDLPLMERLKKKQSVQLSS